MHQVCSQLTSSGEMGIEKSDVSALVNSPCVCASLESKAKEFIPCPYMVGLKIEEKESGEANARLLSFFLKTLHMIHNKDINIEENLSQAFL